jgi:hypothetical protein
MVSAAAPMIILTFEATPAASKFFLATCLVVSQRSGFLTGPTRTSAHFSSSSRVTTSPSSGSALASQIVEYLRGSVRCLTPRQTTWDVPSKRADLKDSPRVDSLRKQVQQLPLRGGYRDRRQSRFVLAGQSTVESIIGLEQKRRVIGIALVKYFKAEGVVREGDSGVAASCHLVREVWWRWRFLSTRDRSYYYSLPMIDSTLDYPVRPLVRGGADTAILGRLLPSDGAECYSAAMWFSYLLSHLLSDECALVHRTRHRSFRSSGKIAIEHIRYQPNAFHPSSMPQPMPPSRIVRFQV